MSRIWLFFLLQLLILRCVSAGTFRLLQPQHGATTFITVGQSTTIPINYEFEASNELVSTFAFCLVLTSLSDGNEFGENCFETMHHALNLNEIGVGRYRVTVYLRDLQVVGSLKVAESVQSVIIEVKKAPLPTVTFTSPSSSAHSLFVGVVDPVTNKATAKLSVQWNGPAEVLSAFEVCLTLLRVQSQGQELEVVMPDACLARTQTTVTLSKLPLGRYELKTRVVNKENREYSGVEDAYGLSIVSLTEAYPILAVLQEGVTAVGSGEGFAYKLEYASESGTDSAKADITVGISSTVASAAALVVACLELLTADQESTLGPPTCLPLGQRTFSISSLPVGVYQAVLFLQPAAYVADVVPGEYAVAVAQSRVLAQIEVRRPEELLPSYDWQVLSPWHTIPSGLEIRLPIGSSRSGGGAAPRKEARIPEPWRLQVELPRPPCRAFFLRMDVRRHTEISDIRREVAKLCKVPEECVQVIGDGAELPLHTTVGNSRYFSIAREIHYNKSC